MLVGRRHFLVGSLGAAAAAVGAPAAVAAAAYRGAPAVVLSHPHGREAHDHLSRARRARFPKRSTEINRYLRDFRTEQIHDIDVACSTRCTTLYTTFDGRGNFEVISGYRSPHTNAALRHVTTGVAENSLHIQGRAIDVRLTSAKTTALRDAAIALKSGGVGYYAESNFVHLDTGDVRSW